MPLNPLSNLKLSLPEIEGSENPGKSLSRDLSSVVSNIDYYNPVPLLAPPTPNIIPDDVDINQNLVGNESTGPNPGAKDVQGGTMDFVSATNSAMGQADVWAKDKYKYGRTYSYGAGYKNMNFDRYYEHPKFKDLGFSPYRDNESAYNEKATWTDDFRRMGTSWSKLVMTGAGSTLFLVDDDEAAEAMEKNMAIGSSSKKGAGAWLTNFGLNSAYTLGILGEVALESLALGALEYFSGGIATPAVAVGVADVSYKLGKLGQGLHGTYNAIKALRSVDTAKEFYNIAKMGAHAKDFAKWLNPLQNSAEFTSNIIKNTNSFDKLSKLQKTTKGFGAFFNDMRQISLAIEEGGMEAATGASKNHQKRIDTFYEKNGYMPEGADAQKIYDETKSLRSSIQLANNGVIFYSNRLVIGKLLKGFPSASIIAKTIGEKSTRTLEKELAADVLTKGALKFGENTFGKKLTKTLISSQYVPWSRVYMTGNISEALQENAQDVIQKGVSAYYDRIDKSPVQAGFWMGVNEIVNASGKQFSAEGLDTFASGFFMGAVAGGVQGGVMSIGKGVSGLRSGNKNKFEQAKIQAEEYENQVLNTVNNIAKSAMDIGQSNSEKAAIVKLYSDEMDKAEDAGSQLDFQNAKEELASEQFYFLAKGGKIKLFTDHMDDMLQVEDKDLANAYKEPIEEIKNVREKLSNLKDRANNFKQSYEKAQEIFKNPNDPYLFNEEKQPEIYNEVLSKYRAHEAAVKDILMHTESSKRITKRLLTMANEFNTTSNWLQVRQGISIISNAGAKDIMSLVDSKQMDLEQETLIKEISLLKEGTPQDKKKAVLLQKKLDSQVKWRNQINAYTEELSFDPKNVTKEVAERRLFDKRLNKGAVIKEKNSTDALTVVSSTTNTITVKDKTGKEKTIPKSNIVEITKESTIPIKNTDVILNDYLEDLHSIFNEYATIIAEEQGGTVNNMELNETFIKIKDFNLLERKSKFLTNSINILTDPTYFNTYVKIQQSVQANRIKNELENIREALKIFMGFKKPNDFLNKLYDIGLFIFTDTKNLELFKTDPKSVTYYSVPNKTVIDPVVTKPTDQKMQEIQKIHDEFFPKPTVVTPVVVPAQPTKVPVTTPVVPVAPVAPVTAAVSTKEPITSVTPIKDLAKQKILVNDLVKAYKEESQTGVLAGKPVLHGVTDTNAKILEVDENDQLINKDFEKFLTLTTASVIFNKFNTIQGRVPTVPPVAEEVIPVEKPVVEPVVELVIEPITAGTMTQTTPYDTTAGPVLTTSTPTTDTKTDINLISTPVSKIVEELSKLNTLNEKLDWLKNNNLLSSININGKEYNTIDYSDRIMVLMKIGKYNIPFYISTGQAGKKTVKAGNWYAVFGIGVEKGWINKGNEKQINNNYGFPVFEKLSKILNEGLGVIQSREDNGNGKLKEGIGFLSDSKQDLEAFNNNMNLPTKPAGKNTDTKDFYDHVNSTLSLLNNELKKLSAVSTSTKPSISVSADTIADIETKIQNLFSYTQRGQISLAGEQYDLINAVRKNPTNENVKKFLELYKNEIGKYEQSIVDEVNTELAALETPTQETQDKVGGSGVVDNSALKDVKSTAKAIEELLDKGSISLPNVEMNVGDNAALKYAEAYHKAKADGSNPELVKAVESLLSKEQPKAESVGVVPVFHHTKVDAKDFDFGNFQRGKNQVSQFGDGLAVSTDTTPFLENRYGKPIKGEVKNSDFIEIDTNKTEKEIYEELKAKGYKFNKPDRGSYIGNDPAKEYDGTEKANEQPAIISLFNDFQKSNPEVKGVKVVNHIIGNEKLSPFYVIYDNKSFYGEGSLKSKAVEQSLKETTKAESVGVNKSINWQDLANNVPAIKSQNIQSQEKLDEYIDLLKKAIIDLSKDKSNKVFVDEKQKILYDITNYIKNNSKVTTLEKTKTDGFNIAIPEFMTPKEFYAIKTFADVQKWQDKFNDLLNNPVTAKKYNLTSQYVDNKINEFKLLIAERVVFEDLTEGVVILDMNNEQKIVTKKNDNQVIITNLDESGAPVLETSTPITKAEIKQKIKYIYRQGMEDIDLSIKLTEEQIVISNENVKNAIDMSIKEKTDNAVNLAKKLTLEERRKKLKDGLGC